jgi:ABC-type transport system involved in multi-copper enzyme maturation permease subunit
MIIFSANATLWCLAGPAAGRGWATNSDFYIARLFGGFCFMTMPLFTALIMGDPVIRDYRTRIDPLIFSKPVSRGQYLLGKFFGNFFVLVCCLGCFALTACLLQPFGRSGMIVLPMRVVPYLTQFFFFVVVSSLALAAICFTVGTLTRNVKIVYGLVTSFYLLYISLQIALKGLPLRWRIILDPLLFNWDELYKRRSADFLNQFVLNYSGDMIANRALMLLVSVICLMSLYFRFSMVERFKKVKRDNQFTTIDLRTIDEHLYNEAASFDFALPAHGEGAAPFKSIALPNVRLLTQGVRASFKRLVAASEVELRLLLAERSLVVLLPIATFVSVLALAEYEVAPGPSYSAAYARRTADSFLLFLLAIAIFYTGEAMHRDRELRIEPVLWSVPAPNFVLLMSKFLTTLLLSISASALVAIAAIALQIYKGHWPVEILTYLKIYSVVLLPGMSFMIAVVMALNVLLRDKYLAYGACLALAGGSFYLFNSGYNHPLYNPVLYGLWTPYDLTSGSGRLTQILIHRIYCLALTVLCLSLTHLFFERKSTNELQEDRHLSGKGWAILTASVATTVAVTIGLLINFGM